MEVDFPSEWELVCEDGEVVTILCELCKQDGKEQRPIKSDKKDKMMSLGEQHRFFRHQREPVGYPEKADFYPLQCGTCEWFFPVQRILDSHEKSCTGVEGRMEAVKKSASGEKNNNIAATNGSVKKGAAEKLAARKPQEKIIAAKKGQDKPAAAKKAQDKPAAAKKTLEKASAANMKLPALSAKMKSALKRHNLLPCRVVLDTLDQHNLPPCKVVLPRMNPAMEKVPKKRKLSAAATGKENGAATKKPAKNARVAVVSKKRETDDDDDADKNDEVEGSPLPSDVTSLGNKWWEDESMEGGFSCPLCKTRPLSKPVFIEDHVAASHFKQRRYVCTICRKRSAEEEDFNETHSWPHRSTLEDHLKKNHPKEFRAKQNSTTAASDFTEILPLLPDAVNVMRLFFKIYPRKGTKVKETYELKKPIRGTAEDNTKKSKCPECDQKFYTRDPRTIIDHVMWRHRDAPRYHCGHCKDDAGFGMIAGFEDHCKKEHGCDKIDYLRLLFMKVDKVAEDLIEQYDVDAEKVASMHEEGVIVSDDEGEEDECNDNDDDESMEDDD